MGVSIDDRLDRLTERHEALTQSMELLSHEIERLLAASQQDAENIRALARTAEIHERRLTTLEGGDSES